mmetsp:Transcript_72060/g.108765  ORF Transcript_72060/g.108765 Transcript_72060/m.108765 type:complete len:389 (+) Transcript_72060:218-1384(+)
MAHSIRIHEHLRVQCDVPAIRAHLHEDGWIDRSADRPHRNRATVRLVHQHAVLGGHRRSMEHVGESVAAGSDVFSNVHQAVAAHVHKLSVDRFGAGWRGLSRQPRAVHHRFHGTRRHSRSACVRAVAPIWDDWLGHHGTSRRAAAGSAGHGGHVHHQRGARTRSHAPHHAAPRHSSQAQCSSREGRLARHVRGPPHHPPPPRNTSHGPVLRRHRILPLRPPSGAGSGERADGAHALDELPRRGSLLLLRRTRHSRPGSGRGDAGVPGPHGGAPLLLLPPRQPLDGAAGRRNPRRDLQSLVHGRVSTLPPTCNQRQRRLPPGFLQRHQGRRRGRDRVTDRDGRQQPQQHRGHVQRLCPRCPRHGCPPYARAGLWPPRAQDQARRAQGRH